MARIFTGGFEVQSLTAGHEFDFINANTGATVALDGTTFRTGLKSVKMILGGVECHVQWQFHATNGNGPYFARLYINVTTMPSVETDITWFQQSNGSFLHCASITLDNGGILRLYNYDGSGVAAQVAAGGPNGNGRSNAISTGAWYCIELKFDRSPAGGSQILEGRWAPDDGTTPVVFATSSTLTIGNAPGTWGVGGNGAGQTATGTYYFDDLALNDNTGASQTSYAGQGKVIILRPNAAGDVNTFATQTGGTAGAANNFTRVNEKPPDDATTFNGSSTLNQEDLMNMDASGLVSTDTIKVVQVNARFRNSTADTAAAFKLEIEKTGAGTISQSAAIVPNSTTWKTNSLAVPNLPPLTLYNDPDAAAWTKTTLDSMQAGYKLTTGPGTAGRRIDVSSVWVYVDYTPAVAVNSSSFFMFFKQY